MPELGLSFTVAALMPLLLAFFVRSILWPFGTSFNPINFVDNEDCRSEWDSRPESPEVVLPFIYLWFLDIWKSFGRHFVELVGDTLLSLPSWNAPLPLPPHLVSTLIARSLNFSIYLDAYRILNCFSLIVSFRFNWPFIGEMLLRSLGMLVAITANEEVVFTN